MWRSEGLEWPVIVDAASSGICGIEESVRNVSVLQFSDLRAMTPATAQKRL